MLRHRIDFSFGWETRFLVLSISVVCCLLETNLNPLALDNNSAAIQAKLRGLMAGVRSVSTLLSESPHHEYHLQAVCATQFPIIVKKI